MAKTQTLLSRAVVGTAITLLTLQAFPLSAQEQHVILTEQSGADGQRTAVLLYEPSHGAPGTGLGFRVHYDSREVDVQAVKNALDLSSVGIQILEDTNDLDDDQRTDYYINAAWVDINGDWPATTAFPLELYRFNFDAVSNNLADLFSIRQSSSSAGFVFVGTVLAN